MTIFFDKIVKAKKKHSCDAIHYIQESMDITMPEHTCNGINIGDEYRKQVHNEDGDFCVFKMCLPCEAYASKHDITLNYWG